MTEPRMSTEFSAETIQNLAVLIGGSFLFFGGKDLPEFWMASQIVVSTNMGDLVFQGEVVELNLEGYVENYSRIRVAPASQKDAASLKSNGQVYFQHAGDEIRDVLIVRRLITEVINGVPSWSLSTSRAVIFDFGATQLCISKLGEHDEALAVTQMQALDLKLVPDTSSYFEADLQYEYRVQDELMSLGGLYV